VTPAGWPAGPRAPHPPRGPPALKSVAARPPRRFRSLWARRCPPTRASAATAVRPAPQRAAGAGERERAWEPDTCTGGAEGRVQAAEVTRGAGAGLLGAGDVEAAQAAKTVIEERQRRRGPWSHYPARPAPGARVACAVARSRALATGAAEADVRGRRERRLRAAAAKAREEGVAFDASAVK
jgi:hypothetical protein